MKSPSMPRLGLIGVGLMGTAIAQRLIANGFHVLGWDHVPDRLREFAVHGGFAAKDVEEPFDKCDCVILSLPDDGVVASVIQAAQSRFRSGQVVIDTSTGDPQATVRMAMRLKDRGVDYLDATVSGSSEQVQAGTAVMLVGASANSFETYQTILKAMVPHVMHVGATGSGAQMKLVTNLVLGLNRAVLAEGLAYAQMLGLPLDKALAVLRASMAYSRIMDTKGEKMINRDFTAQARLSQHAKDVRLILSDAERHRLRLPLTLAHQALLQHAMDLGLGDLDNSAIVQVYEA